MCMLIMNLPYYFVILTFLICQTNSARILGIIHIPAHSHQQLGGRLLKELAAKGHDVTMLSPVDPKCSLKNFKYVQLNYPQLTVDGRQLNMFDMKEKTMLEKVIFMDFIGLKITEMVLNLTEVKTFLNEGHHFDAVIIEEFVNEAFRGFCHQFSAVCIGLSTVGANRWTNRQMGNPANPAYVPELFLSYSDHMNFYQRFINTVITTAELLFNHFYVLPKQNEVLHKYFPDAPSIYDLYYNTSLMLLNTHVSTNFPVPVVPNMIPIGGFHLSPPGKLPQDLQDYLDGASDGAIYFSMGSNLQSSNMDKEKINAFLKVFGKLKQKVLWKWESDTLPGSPPNLKVAKWLPQQEVLAHPNIKLFITHGGLLSTIEAIYHGVPLVTMPIFGDQEMNAANAVNGGYAVLVHYENVNEDSFGTAVNEALHNPKYRDNAQRRMSIFRDEPVKPIDKAIFWVEYVIRHNGAPHLRTAALNLQWYQYLLLDVILFVGGTILVTLIILKKILNKVFRRSTEKVKRTKKID